MSGILKELYSIVKEKYFIKEKMPFFRKYLSQEKKISSKFHKALRKHNNVSKNTVVKFYINKY